MSLELPPIPSPAIAIYLIGLNATPQVSSRSVCPHLACHKKLLEPNAKILARTLAAHLEHHSPCPRDCPACATAKVPPKQIVRCKTCRVKLSIRSAADSTCGLCYRYHRRLLQSLQLLILFHSCAQHEALHNKLKLAIRIRKPHRASTPLQRVARRSSASIRTPRSIGSSEDGHSSAGSP